ncbi:MAG: GIY-YIG nuclease family protein [Patescibacteria group bacterium]
MVIVYAIKSIHRNYIYVGLTIELRTRILRHNRGGHKTTRPYAPFFLIHTKGFNSVREARYYEKYLKSGCGKEYLKSLPI